MGMFHFLHVGQVPMLVCYIWLCCTIFALKELLFVESFLENPPIRTTVVLYHCMSLVYLCFVVSCPSLTDPSNGVMTCSLGDDGVLSYEETCSFMCNTGCELTGSDTRTCQSDGSWSGSMIMCTGNLCIHFTVTCHITYY